MRKRYKIRRSLFEAIVFFSLPEGRTDPCTLDRLIRSPGHRTASITTSECLQTVEIYPVLTLSAYMICYTDEKFCRKPTVLRWRHLVSSSCSLGYFNSK